MTRLEEELGGVARGIFPRMQKQELDFTCYSYFLSEENNVQEHKKTLQRGVLRMNTAVQPPKEKQKAYGEK